VTPQPIEVAAQKPNKYKSEPSSAELQGAVQAIRNRLGGPLSELQFTVDKDSGRSVIKVMDKNSREVLLQIPSEVALRISSELERFQKGLVLNKSA
jgi:flagellar protein FlaG